MVRVVKKPEERRREIIDAACQLFLTRGYDATTMQDVMRELRIAKGTIYHYFSSKEQLLDAVIDHLAADEMRRLQQHMARTKGGALDRLASLILSSARQHREADHGEMLDHLHQAANAGMHIRLLARLLTMQAPLYAELFRQGCEEGIFTTDHPLECAELLLAGIQFLTDIGICSWTEEQLTRRWQAFPALIERQLHAPEGSFSFLHELAHGTNPH